MQQMNEVYDFIDFRNQTRATIERLLRIDVRDYPKIAVREALLNLLVHCDYSFSASALISIYADRIEFVSIGGLMPGIDLEETLLRSYCLTLTQNMKQESFLQRKQNPSQVPLSGLKNPEQ